MLNRKCIASLRIFVSSARLSYVALFYWTRPTAYISSKVLAPFAYMVFFLYLGTLATGPGSGQFYLVGNAMQMAALNGIFGVTMVVGRERNEGTLIYLVGSPANRIAVFFGRALFNLFDGFFTVVLCFAWGMLLGLDLSRANLAGLALIILAVSISTSGLGLLMGSISLMTLNVMFINNMIFFLLLIFSGANLPSAKMPAWVQAVGTALPLTRGIQSARLLVNGASLAEVWPLLTGELAVGLFYALIGFVIFHWFEEQARHRGTLEAF